MINFRSDYIVKNRISRRFFLDCNVMDEEFLWTVFELSARSGFNDDLIRPFPSDYLLKDGTKGTALPN